MTITSVYGYKLAGRDDTDLCIFDFTCPELDSANPWEMYTNIHDRYGFIHCKHGMAHCKSCAPAHQAAPHQAGPLVWDDNQKRCEWETTSRICGDFACPQVHDDENSVQVYSDPSNIYGFIHCSHGIAYCKMCAPGHPLDPHQKGPLLWNNALKTCVFPETKLRALVNYGRRKNRPEIFSVFDLRNWCNEHNEDINNIFVFFTTKQLFQQIRLTTYLQVDATYKITWNELPLLVFGSTDANRHFKPFGIALI
ncbi:unnamed protein product [Didymodactylos carnosus]|uniref:Uncharacterized protein n=1 Tax=Didymodactylos carnosus TaxID=1234261 RepID=A0A815AR81_9BILA|nr:unnamed protein product [Didymodactylos carnosus]CAF1260484.1 unnamed protein product [Didymodactylos carnosus]CAF3874631.1 unnamed protein product [Didymodactylos carnosus]CAF4037488.1 unnamed protein product [Didymodactylos carnosus]